MATAFFGPCRTYRSTEHNCLSHADRHQQFLGGPHSLHLRVLRHPTPSISWIQVRTNMTLATFRDVEVSPDEKTANSTVSTLTIHNPTDPDESNYACVAVNDITNVLGTPETATAELYVQGTLRVILYPFSMLQQHVN